ncbi:MAG TPA: folate-binding protein [Acidobacteriaceae bacterium]
MPIHSHPEDSQTELAAIREAAAIAQLNDRAFLRITGSDAARWLNGMVTNAILTLAPGEGCYNFLLNAQGRIQGDCTIYRETTADPAAFLLATAAQQIEAIQQHLDRFIIMDDVELSRGLHIYGTQSEKDLRGLVLLGPRAAELLLKSVVERDHVTSFAEAPRPGTLTLGSLEGREVVILAPPNTSVLTYEVWCWDTRTIKELYRVWEFYNAVPISAEALEQFRILSATPRYGQDIRNTETARDLPQETSQTHALHFSKGCYLGQEIVERIHSRGQVHRQFVAFRLTGDLPLTLPAPLEAAGKPAGELTSAALVQLPDGPTLVALGYARREALDSRQTFSYAGGTALPHPNKL